MPELEIQPFSDEHLEGAAALLEERHSGHRAVEPGLPANVDYRPEVEALWNAKERSGAVAVRGGELVGYLIGTHREDEIWGSNVWVEYAGHAVREPEIVRDLYAFAAKEWLERGRNRHYAQVPATDPELVNAWFRLSFGAQHASAIQETPEATDETPLGVKVRRAVEDDVDAVVRLDLELPRHQELSPVFAPGPRYTEEESRADFLEELDDRERALLVAEIDGHVVGALVMVDVAKSSLHSGLSRPERAAFLGFAATLPEARGSGAGLALTNGGLAWAREHGYPVTVVDWRETNLLASRFWPARGFRRTFLRLYRSIP
jgi:ribosomal protein S18 acetylase RimI-like enzyme